MSNFDYWERHPDVSKIHDEAMEGLTEMESAPILAAYDFSRFRKVVDVGGGSGSLLAALLRQHPMLTGSLADLPHVVSQAPSMLQRAGVANRCEIIECNFLESVPAGGDAYVLKSVVHNWDDARALTILRNCHRAIGGSGTLLAMDRVLPEQPNAEAFPRYPVDLTMLVMTPGGRERTEVEFKKLLELAGFEFTRVIRAARSISSRHADAKLLIRGEPLRARSKKGHFRLIRWQRAQNRIVLARWAAPLNQTWLALLCKPPGVGILIGS